MRGQVGFFLLVFVLFLINHVIKEEVCLADRKPKQWLKVQGVGAIFFHITRSLEVSSDVRVSASTITLLPQDCRMVTAASSKMPKLRAPEWLCWLTHSLQLRS